MNISASFSVWITLKPAISQFVTLFGKTGLNKNSIVMHFKCIDNVLIMVLNAFVMLFSPL